MTFLLTYWRYVALVFAIAVVVAFLAHLKNSYIKEGYQVCRADAQTELMIQQNQARKQISELEKKYESDIQKIIAQGDSGYGVGPVTSGVLDSLQKRAGAANKR